MYAVKITMPARDGRPGAVIHATVTKHALRALDMKACASVSWSRVRS
jgi:hypothetical protein